MKGADVIASVRLRGLGTLDVLQFMTGKNSALDRLGAVGVDNLYSSALPVVTTLARSSLE